MNSIFEYMFYIIAKINYKGKNSERVVTSITSVQSLFLVNILFFLYELIFGSHPKPLKLAFGITFFIFHIPLYFYNIKKYKRKYQEFHLRWKNDSLFLKIIKFIGILFVIALSFCFGILLSKTYCFIGRNG